MDEKLNQLREKQAEIGDKISLLQKTNKKKDEEAEEIRQLIKECRENLNRIKGLDPNAVTDETFLCPGDVNMDETAKKYNHPPESADMAAPTGQEKKDQGDLPHPCANIDQAKKPDCAALKKKRGSKERVSCKVDLQKMKVRVRGPSEDLKRLDATQLINLLEKFQCQELIINTGEETLKDPGEIRLVHYSHPGNLILLAGVILVAFLLNTNACHVASNKKQFFLNFLYLTSFALHCGMVLWMTFVRGYIMKIGLNDDTFHLIDELILPKYFSVCVLLSALSLYAFLATHSISPCSSWPMNVIAQVTIVVMTFFLELIAICYLVPALIKLRGATDNYVIDEEEPDCNVPPSFETNLNKLCKLSRTLCLINLLTLILLGFNIYYLTTKLKVGN